MGDLQFGELTRTIIGCAMKVHSNFGMGFSENIYKRSLILEMKKAGLICETEVERTVYYYGKIVGKRRLDLIVEKKF